MIFSFSDQCGKHVPYMRRSVAPLKQKQEPHEDSTLVTRTEVAKLTSTSLLTVQRSEKECDGESQTNTPPRYLGGRLGRGEESIPLFHFYHKMCLPLRLFILCKYLLSIQLLLKTTFMSLIRSIFNRLSQVIIPMVC